jgi:hypothetical protein
MIKISDILHCAADKHLAVDAKEYDRVMDKHSFSCVAIEEACETLTGFDYWASDLHDQIIAGLEAMGLDTSSGYAFKPWYKINSPEMQGARYFWLKWAALMAEEQGQ